MNKDKKKKDKKDKIKGRQRIEILQNDVKYYFDRYEKLIKQRQKRIQQINKILEPFKHTKLSNLMEICDLVKLVLNQNSQLTEKQKLKYPSKISQESQTKNHESSIQPQDKQKIMPNHERELVLESQIDSGKQEIANLQQENRRYLQSIQQLKIKCSSLEKQFQKKLKQLEKQLQQQKKQLQQQKKQLQQQKKQLQQQKKQLQQQKKQLQQPKKQHKNEKKDDESKSKQKQKQLKDKISGLTNQFSNKKMQIQGLKKEINKLNQQKLKATEGLKQYKNICISITQQKQGPFPNRLFVNNLIQDESDRQFIINELQKLHTQQRIVKTKLLYCFPQMQLLKIHDHVDNIANYIVIITVKNNHINNINEKPYMVALYSKSPLNPAQQLTVGPGFVASVTNQKVFYMINIQSDPSARLTEYNDFYIVFGKGEIQFKVDKWFLQLNIGHNFKSLNTGAYKSSQIFIGKTDSNIPIKEIEVYQVIFQKK